MNIPQFTYFNLRLSTNLKYIALAICKNTLPKGADYTQIYETFNNDTCQLIFKKLLFDVYNMNKIICSAFDDSNICPISGIVVSNVNLFMTPDFRILYKINTIPVLQKIFVLMINI
jgi:hypothetical protein